MAKVIVNTPSLSTAANAKSVATAGSIFDVKHGAGLDPEHRQAHSKRVKATILIFHREHAHENGTSKTLPRLRPSRYAQRRWHQRNFVGARAALPEVPMLLRADGEALPLDVCVHIVYSCGIMDVLRAQENSVEESCLAPRRGNAKHSTGQLLDVGLLESLRETMDLRSTPPRLLMSRL